MSKGDQDVATNHSRIRQLAPDAFRVGRSWAVPVHFCELQLHFTLLPNENPPQLLARATVRFASLEDGFPFMDLVPEPTRIRLDGEVLTPDDFPVVATPEDVTQVRMLQALCRATSVRTLEVEYKIDSKQAWILDSATGTSRFRFKMRDLADRWYLEQYGPANLQFDQHPICVALRVEGKVGPHRLFANGNVQLTGPQSWRVDFPEWFNCTCPYLDITNEILSWREDIHAGMNVSFPVQVYGTDPAMVDQALGWSRTILRELESHLGPYPHPALLVRCKGSDGTGMEYAGATETALTSLRHELLHQWFGRSVLPADGNAGWIDEALAVWGEFSFPDASNPAEEDAANLAGYSQYRRTTPDVAYRQGYRFVRYLAHLFGKKVFLHKLREWHTHQAHHPITTCDFEGAVSDRCHPDVSDLFRKYVYGP